MNYLREKRIEKGLSQTRLSHLVNVPSSLISDIEQGQRQPYPRAKRELARALGTTENDLFPINQL